MSVLTGNTVFETNENSFPHANAYYENNITETVIVTTNAFVKPAGSWLSSSSEEFTVDGTGKLTYTGTVRKHFHIVSNFDMTTASNSQIIAFKWFKNGTTPLPAQVKRKVGTGSDLGAASVHADAMLNENDYVELKVANATSISNITLQNVYCFVMGMPMI